MKCYLIFLSLIIMENGQRLISKGRNIDIMADPSLQMKKECRLWSTSLGLRATSPANAVRQAWWAWRLRPSSELLTPCRLVGAPPTSRLTPHTLRMCSDTRLPRMTSQRRDAPDKPSQTFQNWMLLFSSAAGSESLRPGCLFKHQHTCQTVIFIHRMFSE